jgi:hypothetical protein
MRRLTHSCGLLTKQCSGLHGPDCPRNLMRHLNSSRGLVLTKNQLIGLLGPNLPGHHKTPHLQVLTSLMDEELPLSMCSCFRVSGPYTHSFATPIHKMKHSVQETSASHTTAQTQSRTTSTRKGTFSGLCVIGVS